MTAECARHAMCQIAKSGASMIEQPAIRFFHVWDTYAKVVANNYMFHHEIGEAIKAALAERFRGQSFSVLDLGCGDAATFAPILNDFALTGYCGVDLSESALAIAAHNLSGLSCPLELKQAEIMREVAVAKPADVIYASFSVHHLATVQKAEFFRLAAQKLKTGGLLIIADVQREEGQDLDAYLTAFCEWTRRSMIALDAAEQDAICEHVGNYDFPEPLSVTKEQAETAGLVLASTTMPHKWFRLAVFEKG